MSDETKFNWPEWAAKQGTMFVLLVVFGAFFRQDVWVPVRNALEQQTQILHGISNVQVQIRDEQRRGVWRATEPPQPNELPKGVEPRQE